MQQEQGKVYKSSGGDCLDNADDGGLLADVFDFLQTEFVADGESDKAQGHVGNQPHFLHKVKGLKAEAGNAQSTQTQGAHQ